MNRPVIFKANAFAFGTAKRRRVSLGNRMTA